MYESGSLSLQSSPYTRRALSDRIARRAMRVILLLFFLFIPSFSHAATIDFDWSVNSFGSTTVSFPVDLDVSLDYGSTTINLYDSERNLVSTTCTYTWTPVLSGAYPSVGIAVCAHLGGMAHAIPRKYNSSSNRCEDMRFTQWYGPLTAGYYYEFLVESTTLGSDIYRLYSVADSNSNLVYTPAPLTVFNYDPDLTTRFTSLSITGTSTVTVSTTQYVNPSEVSTSTPSRNPTLVKFSLSLNPSTTSSAYSVSLTPTTGTSTASYNFSSLADGTYDLLVSFSSIACSLSSVCPFPNIHIYSSFVISGGVLSATGSPEFYDGLRYSQDGVYIPHECGLSDIEGCVFNILTWIFVPPQAGIENILDNVISTSSMPALGLMYARYDMISEVSNITTASTATSALSYRLQIPEADIDVEMFGVGLMSQLMGTTAKGYFRLICQMAVWLGFIAMVGNSLNNMITVINIDKRRV